MIIKTDEKYVFVFTSFHSVVATFVFKNICKKNCCNKITKSKAHLNIIIAEVEKKIFEIVKLEAKQQPDLIFIYAKRT